ncbi:MAG: hypothetical protein V7K99_24565 [Nostoc sp.]
MSATELLEAREKFLIDKFNEAGITTDATRLTDIFAARFNKDLGNVEPYLEFILRVMGD